MARKTIEQRAAGYWMGGLGLALLLVAAAITMIRAYPLQLAVLAIAVTAGASWLGRRARRRRQAERELAEHCAARQMERHRKTLVSYFRQSIRPGPFGGEDATVWERHILSFLDTQVAPHLLSSSAVRRSSELDAHLRAYVDAWVRSANAQALRSEDQSVDPATITAVEYEQFCAALLSRSGWMVQSTPVNGDRGADVVAEKKGQRLIVQCKLYAQPVGNKAVQEVYSARPLYNADHACVVAPRGFTAQAQRDAHALGVGLLHHSELQSFAGSLPERRRLEPDFPAIAPAARGHLRLGTGE